MKKTGKIIFIVVFTLIIIFVMALLAIKFVFKTETKNNKVSHNNNITMKCSKNNISVGKTIKCTLKGYSKEEISMFEGKLVNNSNIKISDIKKSSKWVIGSNDSNMQLISDGVKGNFEIITFNVTGVESGTGIVEIKKLKNPLAFTSKNMEVYNLDNVSYEIEVK